MEDKKLNEQESLALIARMIQNTQNRMERNSGTPFLIWGYTTVVISVAIWTLVTVTNSYYWQFLWFALPVICLPTTYIIEKNKDKGIKTYIDKITNHIWLVLGIAGFMASVPPWFLQGKFPVLFCIILLMGMGTALTGLIIKFKPCIWGGFISMGLAYMTIIFKGLDSILIFALVFIIMMVIPGHILNARAKKLNHVK